MTVIASNYLVFIAGLCVLIWHYFKKMYSMIKIGDDKREYQYTCIYNPALDDFIQLLGLSLQKNWIKCNPDFFFKNRIKRKYKRNAMIYKPLST